MRYKVTFRRKYSYLPCFCINYRPLFNRSESFLAYVIAEKLKERGVLSPYVFDLETVEKELARTIKRVGNVFLASCMYLHPTLRKDEEKSIEEKFKDAVREFDISFLLGRQRQKDYVTTKVGIIKNYDVLDICSIGLETDFLKHRTYIIQNLSGNGAAANKIYTDYITEAREVSFIIESDLSKEELYELLEDKDFTFFSKRKLNAGKFEIDEIEKTSEEIIRFVPCDSLLELAKQYEVRVINDIVIREAESFVPWHGRRVNGVFCAIGKKKENGKIDEKVEKAYMLKDLDLRLGSVLVGADEINVDMRKFRKVNGICGLCRYEGEVYEKKGGGFWEKFTSHNMLYNTEYLCESCLKVKGLIGKKSEYKNFKLVNSMLYDAKVDVELPNGGTVILSLSSGTQAGFYFAEPNYVFGDNVWFLIANYGTQKTVKYVNGNSF